MSRTTSDLVQGILLTGINYPRETRLQKDLTPFIDAASSIVDQVIACATRKGVTLADATPEILERWLSAHFYQMADESFTSTGTRGASASRKGQFSTGFMITTYGQMAIALDSSGCLKAIGAGNRGQALWLGRAPDVQTDAVDRGY